MSEELYCINYTFPSVGDSKLLTPAVVNKQTRRKVNKHRTLPCILVNSEFLVTTMILLCYIISEDQTKSMSMTR